MHKVGRLLLLQLGVCLLLPLGLYFMSGKQAAWSALAGGMVAFLPAVLFAKMAFKYQGARAAREIVKSIYLGEGLKIMFSALLFALVFIFYKVSPLTFFLAWIAVNMSHWFAPLIITNKQNRFESD